MTTDIIGYAVLLAVVAPVLIPVACLLINAIFPCRWARAVVDWAENSFLV